MCAAFPSFHVSLPRRTSLPMAGKPRSLGSSPVSGSAPPEHRASAITVRTHADEHLPLCVVQASNAPSSSAGASSPPLKAFLVNPACAASATAIVPENVAEAQRRWHADMHEVEAYLNALDSARADSAKAGLYHRAQQCMQRMEKIIRLLAKRISREANTMAERARQALTEQQRLLQRNFRKSWKTKMLVYEENASAMLAAAEQHHYAERVREDARAHEELRSARAGGSVAHSWSSKVQHLQSELQLYLRQHRYREAERVQAQLSRFEKQEQQAQQRNITHLQEQRLQAMRVKQEEQLAKIKAAHQQEKQEIARTCRAELDAMTRQHEAALQAVEERRLFLHERVQAILKAYNDADALDPRATGLKLIRISQLLWTSREVQQPSEHI
ncbi:hypothetical protein conserved [Leishmania donovani]|uniref:Hypothetical_protein_conserved n=1 Tax=Leishmania donovani TaxID=5661 RepID=A0A6J8FSR6_LEIDO|nr:hypothetical protein conserved [Leishmania donovani]VDZ49374.1 hypothetical_protein_conserved [Leishmania donovani]